MLASIGELAVQTQYYFLEAALAGEIQNRAAAKPFMNDRADTELEQ